jgi:hypothetical protein
MLGQPRLRLIHRQCVDCGEADSFEAYHKLVPPQGQYAFDLIAEVGLARLRDQRQDGEIQRFVQERWELSLPASSIGLIVHSFLDGVSALHQAHGPALRQWLEAQGGYALHVDGTCEPDTDVLFLATAQPQGWTLEVGKMGSENASDISQLMRRCAEHFGPPHAVVRDLSKNIEKAKHEALPNVPDLICHYHFQENVGEKLCEEPHAKLGNALRRLKVRPALTSLRKELVRWNNKTTALSRSEIEQLLLHPEEIAKFDPVALRRVVAYVLLRWLDDYTADLRGEYFPFDLPNLAFYRRGIQLGQLVGELVAHPDFPGQRLSTLETMARHLAFLRDDADIVAAAQRLEKAAALFQELRDVLRLSNHPRNRLLRGHASSEVAASQESAEQLQQHLTAWRDRLARRHQGERDEHKRADRATVLKYLEKYEHQLVGHVIEREGQEPFIVCRTNNPAEHRFQVTKRGIRRKVGSKKLTRQIQAMRAEALLVWNLTDQKYVELVLDGNLAHLPAAIATHWPAAQVIRQQRQTPPPTEYPIPTTKKQIRDPSLLKTIKTIANNLINLMKDLAHAA